MQIPGPAQVQLASLPLPLVPSGLYVQLALDNNGSNSSVNNQEQVIGFLVGAQTIAELAFWVKTASTDVGSVMRVGVRADASGKPGTPRVEGTAPITGTGWQTVVVNYAHPGGILWVSMTAQNQPVSAAGVATGGGSDGWPIVGAAALSTPGWASGHGPNVGAQTGVTGALPAGFTNTRSTNLAVWVIAAKGG